MKIYILNKLEADNFEGYELNASSSVQVFKTLEEAQDAMKAEYDNLVENIIDHMRNNEDEWEDCEEDEYEIEGEGTYHRVEIEEKRIFVECWTDCSDMWEVDLTISEQDLDI